MLGVLALPAAVALARQTARVDLLDAAWAIPVGDRSQHRRALLFARGARGRIRSTLERAGGARPRARAPRGSPSPASASRSSASIAVGFYELLVRLEH